MIINRGVAPARATLPRRRGRRIAIIVLAVLAIVAIALLLARDSIERALLERRLATALDGVVTIGSLAHDGDRTILHGVHLASAADVLTLDGDVDYTTQSNVLLITLRGAKATAQLDHIGGEDLDRGRALIDALGSETVKVFIRDGSALLERGEDQTLATAIDAIGGTVFINGRNALFDGAFSVDSNSIEYPLTATRVADASGVMRQHLTGAALPLAALKPFALGELHVDDGFARSIDYTLGGTERGRFALDAATVRIGERTIRGMAGTVLTSTDGIGSPGLTGQVEGVPLTVTGEVHGANAARDFHQLVHLFSSIAAQRSLRWMKVETTAPGIAYGQYAMTTKETPHVVQLIAVDPHEPTVHFDTAISGDHVVSRGERTSDLGSRTNAVAGINGDYFDIGRTYEPQGMLIRSGTIVRGPTDREALVIDRNGNVTFAQFRLHGRATWQSHRYDITQLNTWPAGAATIITPDYGTTLPAAPADTFAALTHLDGDRYRVESIHAVTAAMPVTFGIAFGSLVHETLPTAGAIVRLSYALDPPVNGAFAGIGGGPLLLRDGAWYEDPRAPAPDERDVQWPVIGVGRLADSTLLFAAVDGRHPERSIGMTRPDFAELLRGFGVVDAMALDSGGSVTLVSRAPGDSAISVRNVPSDNSAERYISDALFVYSSAPRGTLVPKPKPEPSPSLAPAL